MITGGLTLGIDGANIRQGGGLTHLSQLLSAANPAVSSFHKVIVWAGADTLRRLPDFNWLSKRTSLHLNGSLVFRSYWQQFLLPKELVINQCAALFSPGGMVPVLGKVPVVSMSQNMLPFEPQEAFLFGKFSLMRFKMRLLRNSQTRSFQSADGIIFLSEYARDTLLSRLKINSKRVALIPHGIESRFFLAPRRARTVDSCSFSDPFRFIYVSILMPYKHQIEVARAAAYLRTRGVPVAVDFVGAVWGGYGQSVVDECARLDPSHKFLRCMGEVPFDHLHSLYGSADAFVFASSCENLPNIVIEAMASGLPILCSNRGPMPEVVGDAGLFFDPYSVESLVEAMSVFIGDAGLRSLLADRAYARARRYSWRRCADETFSFIADVASRANA